MALMKNTIGASGTPRMVVRSPKSSADRARLQVTAPSSALMAVASAMPAPCCSLRSPERWGSASRSTTTCSRRCVASTMPLKMTPTISSSVISTAPRTGKEKT